METLHMANWPRWSKSVWAGFGLKTHSFSEEERGICKGAKVKLNN